MGLVRPPHVMPDMKTTVLTRPLRFRSSFLTVTPSLSLTHTHSFVRDLELLSPLFPTIS